jgi:hypothetical protein
MTSRALGALSVPQVGFDLSSNPGPGQDVYDPMDSVPADNNEPETSSQPPGVVFEKEVDVDKFWSDDKWAAALSEVNDKARGHVETMRNAKDIQTSRGSWDLVTRARAAVSTAANCTTLIGRIRVDPQPLVVLNPFREKALRIHQSIRQLSQAPQLDFTMLHSLNQDLNTILSSLPTAEFATQFRKAVIQHHLNKVLLDMREKAVAELIKILNNLTATKGDSHYLRLVCDWVAPLTEGYSEDIFEADSPVTCSDCRRSTTSSGSRCLFCPCKKICAGEFDFPISDVDVLNSLLDADPFSAPSVREAATKFVFDMLGLHVTL